VHGQSLGGHQTIEAVPSSSSDILSALRLTAGRAPDAIALMEPGGSELTYDALLARVEAIAAVLAGVAGAGRRPRVGIVLPNGLDMAVTLLGVTCAGAALPFNPTYKAAEYEAYFRETRLDALLVSATDEGEAVATARALALPLLRLASDGAIHGVSGSPGNVPQPAADDVALVLLTSGSTGRAKAVPLTHRNVCTSAGDVARSMGLSPSDRCLAMWEQFHVGGLVDLLLAPLLSGGTLICTPGFDAARFFELLPVVRPSWFQGVPATLNELVVHARRNAIAVAPHSLRLLRSVAAALPPQVMQDIEETFGVPVLQTFGMTEAGPLITSTALPPALRKPGSVGHSCGPQLRIVGPAGETLPVGGTGEVAVRGDNVFAGYENDPEANAQQFRAGWFHTGDLGHLDPDGDLFLTGRIKQLINRGGEKVNPQELDDALMTHEAVAQAACYAVPHRTLGEDVAAAVVLRDGRTVGPEELRTFLRARLAAFKVPARIRIVDDLPRNMIGKIDRMALSRLDSGPADETGGVAASADGASGTEQTIAAIWAEELELPKVGLDADFFAVGGDSLSAVRVFLAVEAAFGRKLPEEMLGQITTVRAMARAVDEAQPQAEPADMTAVPVEDGLSAADARSLASVMALGSIAVLRPGSAMKAVNTNGTRIPLFWCFNSPAREMGSLAPHLDADQPLFGLYSGGRLFPPSDDMLDRLARHYAAEILSLDPTGPCYLGGNCRGGWIAERLERLLSAAGKPVLGMIILEHATPRMAAFEGRLLFMFGKQSRLRAYRAIGWPRPGWERPFTGPVEAIWVHGGHAEFFRPENVEAVASATATFLDGQPVATEERRDGFADTIHKIPGALGVYRTFHKIRDGGLFRRKARVNPFTGERDT
jgi:acyl-CoA synthetase (AMP-forming)/AMP-acid ligase II/acyl carrier protein